MDVERYRVPGPLTRLRPEQVASLAELGDPVALGRVAQGLLLLPDLAAGVGVPTERVDERNIRPAADILDRAIELHPGPLDEPRPLDRRVVGTCRHFAVVHVALLRAAGVPARARCGFATYFEPGLAVDHWITEHWDGDADRWVRIDSEILGFDGAFADRPTDLAPDDFLTGGEAWLRYRGGDDPMRYGVTGTDHAWGPAEIVGNAIRDLAALNRVELLPWDEWGPMAQSYRGDISADTEALIDDIAAATDATADDVTADDRAAIRSLYERDGVAPPDDLLR